MTFTHPANGYTIHVRAPGLWTFLFGPLYFASHGVWNHVFISAIVAVCTMGLSWLLYPLFASGILRHAYLKRGWKEVGRDWSDPAYEGRQTA